MTESVAEPLRVAVMSHRQIIARGTATLLGEHPQRVRLVETSTMADGERVDVAVYDLDLVRVAGESHLGRVVERVGGRVVGLATGAASPLAARALALGVAGCVALDATPADLVEAVTTAAAGQHLEARLTVHDLLTPQERAIVRLIFSGLSNSQIAEKLYISANTLKSHIRAAYRKMGVRSRPQAVAWCARHGLTSLDEQEL